MHSTPHYVTLYVENGQNSLRCRCGEELDPAVSRLSIPELVEVAQRHLAQTRVWVCELADELGRWVVDQLGDRGIEGAIHIEHEHREPELGETAELEIRIRVDSQALALELSPEALEARADELGLGTSGELGEFLDRARRDPGRPCMNCGGPNDHGTDCLPASQGGTQKDTQWSS